MIDWIPLSSTRITDYAYDDEEARVLVRFTNGTCWEYRGVPAGVWADFQAAPSKGRFISQVLDAYPDGEVGC